MRYLFSQACNFTFSAGANGVYQNSKNLGTLLLIPNYHFFQMGDFAIANEKLGNLTLSGGIRYDNRTFTGSDRWVDSITKTPASEGADNVFHAFEGFTTYFNGVSFSMGGTYDFTKNMYFKTNVARGWRAPNVAESAANSVHDGTVVYKIGDPTLIPKPASKKMLLLAFTQKIFLLKPTCLITPSITLFKQEDC